MKISFTTYDDVIVVKLNGSRFDAAAAPAFKSDLARLLGEGFQGVVVDFSAVELVDSSGLSALISVAKTLRNGRFIVSAPSLYVRSLFEVTRLDKILGISPDTPTALGQL